MFACRVGSFPVDAAIPTVSLIVDLAYDIGMNNCNFESDDKRPQEEPQSDRLSTESFGLSVDSMKQQAAPERPLDPKGFELKIPKFDRVENADGSTTITDEVGLKLEFVPGVSEQAKNSAMFYSSAMPESQRRAMADAGIPIYVVNAMSDLNPELKGKALPFEDQRKTWDEVGAAYIDTKRWPGLIGKNAVVITPEFVPVALNHEGAHALDDIAGRPTETPEFQEMWANDLKNAREQKLGINPYLSQGGRRGPEEAFAAVYEALTARVRNAGQEQTLEVFPTIARFVQEKFLAEPC